MATLSKPVRLRTFYGRRKGHALSARQKNLLKNLLSDVTIELLGEDGGSLDPASLFEPTKSACWLEIGFGKGEHLAWQAERRPQVGFIGCEPYVNGVVGLLTRIEEQNLSNIRICPDEAQPLLEALPGHSLGRVFLLHPDPWLKRRHRDRRFVSQENLDLLAYVMVPGAELRIGTDSSQYVDWTKEQMAKRRDFRPVTGLATAGGDSDGLDDWPLTRYEAKAKRQGHTATRLIYKRT